MYLSAGGQLLLAGKITWKHHWTMRMEKFDTPAIRRSALAKTSFGNNGLLHLTKTTASLFCDIFQDQ